MRPLIQGLSWKHPAAMLFLAVMIIGGAAMYIETSVPVGTNGSTTHRDVLYSFLAVTSLYVWGRILIQMIIYPEDFLPNRSLTLDADIYEQREKFIQSVGYVLGFFTVLFAIYKILLLAPAM